MKPVENTNEQEKSVFKSWLSVSQSMMINQSCSHVQPLFTRALTPLVGAPVAFVHLQDATSPQLALSPWLRRYQAAQVARSSRGGNHGSKTGMSCVPHPVTSACTVWSIGTACRSHTKREPLCDRSSRSRVPRCEVAVTTFRCAVAMPSLGLGLGLGLGLRLGSTSAAPSP